MSSFRRLGVPPCPKATVGRWDSVGHRKSAPREKSESQMPATKNACPTTSHRPAAAVASVEIGGRP